ncbi:DUF2188 domain-containing protein [Croceicoccus marinus]|uniref:DUF2188 domain-containing protein n=1 Tax=Croceicoccus marinus TaxID=450378 RepID=A0A1Z1FCF0_9SPHN|nr:DUF2188 domain-containing protein [Croceicoccus marinus]ARU16435.1 hypothetical protein A9D14_09905 [Croceicoccus marinus]
MADDYWATKHPNGWQVKGAGNERATSVHRTQADAWSEAKSRARASGGEAYLTKENGQIRERNTYGRDPRSTKG